MSPLPERLADLAREVLTPLDAPASYLHSRVIGPEEIADADDVDEWVALDVAVALRIAAAAHHDATLSAQPQPPHDSAALAHSQARHDAAARAQSQPRNDAAVVLRVEPGAAALLAAPRAPGLAIEAIVRGENAHELARSALAVARALDAGVRVRAVLAAGETGIDVYRAAAAARQVLGTRVPIRVRWDDGMDIKGAALGLTFGADELAGPLAPARTRWKLAQIGGPPEESHQPSPAHVESLMRAAGRYPVRKK